MRELFDEVAGKSPLDPREASRKSSRTPLRKRFYTSTGVAEGPDGFGVTLDGKPIRTPGRNLLTAPTRDLAEAMAAEWDAQKDDIDPMAMPLTRLANSVIDGVAGNVQAVAADAAGRGLAGRPSQNLPGGNLEQKHEKRGKRENVENGEKKTWNRGPASPQKEPTRTPPYDRQLPKKSPNKNKLTRNKVSPKSLVSLRT